MNEYTICFVGFEPFVIIASLFKYRYDMKAIEFYIKDEMIAMFPICNIVSVVKDTTIR